MATMYFPYGDTTVEAEIPEGARRIGLPRPAANGTKQSRAEREATVGNAIANPLGMPRIRDQVTAGAKVLIAFDDPTVRGGGDVRELVIEQCLAELAEAGVDEENVSLVCANALHRKFTHDELRTQLGSDLVDRFADRLWCHDAEDRERLVDYGTTRNGHAVEINRDAVEADLCIYVNAGCSMGFSGGWKSIVIGLSTWKSIKSTHHPDGMSMSVRHNRMHEVLDEMGGHLEARLGKRFFKVETVMKNAETIEGMWAGGVRETRDEALELLEGKHPPRRGASPEKADVVVYGVADTSPYAVFGRPNPILTLISSGLGYQGGYVQALGKPGCTVVMATPAREEWDMEHHPAYREVWDEVLPGQHDAYAIDHQYAEAFAQRDDYIDHYRHGVAFHPVHAILATQPLRRLQHAGRVIVAGAEDPAVPARVGFESASSVEAALSMATAAHGQDSTIAAIGMEGDVGMVPRADRLQR